jgi:hypothetical protein
MFVFRLSCWAITCGRLGLLEKPYHGPRKTKTIAAVDFCSFGLLSRILASIRLYRQRRRTEEKKKAKKKPMILSFSPRLFSNAMTMTTVHPVVRPDHCC